VGAAIFSFCCKANNQINFSDKHSIVVRAANIAAVSQTQKCIHYQQMHSDTVHFVQNMKSNGAVGNLNGVKPNERVVKCRWVKFKWEEGKCREV
jgi:hypothetical protein